MRDTLMVDFIEASAFMREALYAFYRVIRNDSSADERRAAMKQPESSHAMNYPAREQRR